MCICITRPPKQALTRRLCQAYRSLRYQLEDLSPPGVKVELLDEVSLQIEGDVGDIEKQQRQLIEELRDKLSRAESTAVAKSEHALKEAERFTQKAAEMQRELAGFKTKVLKLEDEKALALEDARSKDNEMHRLEKQLLQELHDLKTRGVQTVAPPAAAAAAAAVEEEEAAAAAVRRPFDQSKRPARRRSPRKIVTSTLRQSFFGFWLRATLRRCTLTRNSFLLPVTGRDLQLRRPKRRS